MNSLVGLALFALGWLNALAALILRATDKSSRAGRHLLGAAATLLGLGLLAAGLPGRLAWTQPAWARLAVLQGVGCLLLAGLWHRPAGKAAPAWPLIMGGLGLLCGIWGLIQFLLGM